MKRLLIGVLISFVTLSVAATAVFGAATPHRSTVKIAASSTSSLVHGKVKSEAGQCSKGRKVQLFIGSTASQQLVDTVRTSSDGRWSVTFHSPKPGRYQAKAVRTTYTDHGENNVCKPARSEKVDIFPASPRPARHHSSTATINLFPGSSDTFYGKVSGGPTRCWFDREVDLELGPAGVDPTIVGADITSTNGDWFVSLRSPQAGEYWAVALRKTYKVHGVRHICDRAVSPRLLDA